MKPFEIVIIACAAFGAFIYLLLYLARKTEVPGDDCEADPSRCTGCPMAGGCSAGKRLTRPGPGD